jgi:radical SAM protein with 4Fe4S-binding SPASM domain
MDTLRLIQLETQSACNARCEFCPTGTQERKRPVVKMPMSLIRSIIDQGIALGVRTFAPFKDNEPLMDVRLFTVLDILASHGVAIHLSTNASLLTAKRADQLATYPDLTLTLSLHGQAFNGLDETKVSANAHYMASLRPIIAYRLDCPATHDTIEAFKAEWGSLAMVSESYQNYGGTIPVPDQNARWLLPPVPCFRLLSQMAINASGIVALCCQDVEAAVPLGDLNTESLETVWNRAQSLRDRHRAYDFDMELCRDCVMNRYPGVPRFD